MKNQLLTNKMKRNMKRVKLFLMLMLLTVMSTNAWSAVVSGTTYNFSSSSTPSGWNVSYGDTKSGYVVLYKPNYIRSEAFFQKSITSIVVNMRSYGGTTAEGKVTLTWVDSETGTETALGVLTPDGTTLGNKTLSSFTNTPTTNTTGYIKFTCVNGNSTSKGGGIAAITINYTECSSKVGVHISSVSNGSASTDLDEACPGQKVTITVKPNSNYAFDPNSEYSYAFYWDASGDAAYPAFSSSFFTKVGPNQYSFIMPEVDVESYELMVTDVEIDIHCDVVSVASLPNRTVTFHVPTGTGCVTSPVDGAEISAKVFPRATPLLPGYKFEGWITSEIAGTQSSRPGTIYGVGEAIPANGTYYALYSQVSSVFALVDNLTPGKNYMLCSAYNSSSGAVMSNEFNNAGTALVAESWTISDYSTAPKMTCTDYSCIWQITEIGSTGKYSVYNEEKGQYAQFTGTNNQITLVNTTSDSKAKWTYETGSSHTSKLYTIVSSTKYYICQGGSSNPYAARSTLSNMYLFEQQTVSASYTTNPSTCVTNYTVTYNAGGGTGTVTDSNNPYNAGDEVTVLSNGFTKTDYNFTHWTANVDVVNYSTSATITEGSAIAPGTHITMPSSDVVLTANWEAKEYLYGSSCTPLTNITITYSDNGNTTDVEYGVGTTVAVDSRTGTHGCAEWTFVGWQRGSAVANNSTSYTPTHNFTAAAGDDGVTFYAVYEKVNTDWISALNTSEMKSGATYVIVRKQATSNHRALTTTVANTSYLAGTLLSTDCEEIRTAGPPITYNYKLKVTPTNDIKWELSYVSNKWRLFNKATGKYLKINSDGTVGLSNAYDAMTLEDGTDQTISDIRVKSDAANKYLYWDNTNTYWKGYGSANILCLLTNSNSFTSTPDCGLRTATFHGNGGTVIASGGSPTGANLGIQETVRDEPITTPTATFADCNGKSWSFIGWADHEIDVTRVPVLTTDLLNDGGGNKSHTITASNEEYWAVFSNTGAAETKYGTINIVPADIHGDYRDELTFTKTVTSMGDYTFAYYHVGDQSSLGIQFDYANATKGYLKNTTSLGKINSISFSTFGTGSISDVQVYVGNSADACNTLLTAAELQTVSGVSTYYPKNNYAYVKIQASAYVGIGTISIDFGKPTQVWATTPDCSTITLSGTPRITSYADKTVKGVTTLTVNAQQLASNTPLSFAAYNVSDDTPNSHFGFVGSVSALADGSVTDQTIVVTYRPDAGATTDGIEEVYFKATALADDNVTTTESNKQSGYGRHLPTKFVIATKVGDKWYGMPNNIATASYGTRALIPIVVNDATSPTTATIYTSTTDYLAWNLDVAGTGTARYTNKGDHLFFSSPINSNRNLAGDTDGLRNSAVALTSSGYDAFAWSPTTTDLGNYTLKNGNATTYYIATDGSANWTTSTTGANVRFLIIDERPAPDITWYNDMLDAEHTSNKAENGVVTLPTGEDPLCCLAAREVLTFDGWVTSTWSGYKTTGFTKVNNGDAATADATYYAVFKTGDNKYFTKCPTIVTVTYTANGGTGSDVVESYPITSSSGTSVTLKDVTANGGTIGFSKDGYVFVGWTTSSNYGSEFKYAGNTVTVKEVDNTNYGNLTLSAVWVGELTITGDVHLTSTYTSAARSEANTVYTTANPNNLITFSIEDVPASVDFKLRTSYLTSGDASQDKNTCPFRLCNDGSSNYNIVDGSNLNVATGDYSQTYAIGYKPGVTGGTNGTTETYKLKMELINSGGDKIFDTKTLTLYGRVLPNHFVIAAKINGQWCALPADIATSSGSAIANAYPITVNNQTTPTVATSAPKAALYSGTVRAHNDHRGGIRLTTATGDGNDGQLQATRSDNTYLWRTTSDCTTGMQEWYLVSSNFSQYEVRLDGTLKRSNAGGEGAGDDSGNPVDRQLCVSGSQILFGKTSAKTMYILPVTEEFTPVEIQVVTWRSNAVQFMYFGNPAYTAEVEIEGVNKASAQALGTALKIDHGVYEIAVSDLMSNANKQMHIIIKNGGSEIGRKAVTIPLMTNSATTVNAARTAASINKGDCSGVDLVVLSNVLTADDATAHEFNSVTVYGGAKLSVTGNLTAKKMYLRAGNVTAGTKGTTPVTSYSYVYPQVYVGSSSTLTINENIINFDYLTNYDQYFGVAFPHTLTIDKNNIFYPEDIYGSAAKTGSYLLRVFDSQIRAERGAVDDVWVDVETGSTAMPKQTTTTRGLGYYVLLPPRKVSVNGGANTRQTYGIQRMKLSVANAAALTTAENSDATIAVSAYSASSIVNTGWWMLGNPYMASLGTGTGDADRVGGASITVGSIGTNAQGQYEWKSSSVRYVTVPDDGAGDTYDQRRVIDYDFPAFKPFYVQVGASGDVTFSYASRNSAAPARISNNSMPQEINVAVALSTATYGDTTYLLVGDAFSAAYEIGDDLMKMPHANVSLFTIGSEYDLFANALNKQSAEEGVPVGYIAPSAGYYLFSHVENDESTWLEHLWLEDKETGAKVDLLDAPYEFETTAGTNKTRFVLFAVLKKNSETPTDIGGTGEEIDKPIKFIYNDKMYILRNGILYDATGKRVREINK